MILDRSGTLKSSPWGLETIIASQRVARTGAAPPQRRRGSITATSRRRWMRRGNRRDESAGGIISQRRPRESGDPYAAASRFGTVADGFYPNRLKWLWVPASAETTHSVARSYAMDRYGFDFSNSIVVGRSDSAPRGAMRSRALRGSPVPARERPPVVSIGAAVCRQRYRAG